MATRGSAPADRAASRGHEYLERVKRIVLDNLAGYGARVFLFGSWVRGGAVPASDIDVGILPETALPPGLLSRLRDALEESDVPYPVDLVDLSEAEPGFRRRVLAEGVQWTA